ncbi:hypothetical protein D3C72_2569670 [compost metagenome]
MAARDTAAVTAPAIVSKIVFMIFPVDCEQHAAVDAGNGGRQSLLRVPDRRSQAWAR